VRHNRFDVDLIRRDMDIQGWNQRELARLAGLSEQVVSMFMSGTSQTAKTAIAIARAFGYKTSRRYLISKHQERVA
jgi:transcriptional regulator with XRE-family HTH domain